MWRWVLAALAIVGVAIALVAMFVQPPAILSFLDGMMGGGKGARRMVTAQPFGTHGQTLDVWRPAVRANDPRPVIVFWHGGGWVKGDAAAYAFAGRALAARGFVVVLPNYRKVPGVRFPAFVEDGAQAMRWVRDHIAEQGGDPNRIALSGHSAGAHTAVLLALDPTWLRAEGVDPTIVKAVVGLSGPYDFFPFATKRSIDAFEGTGDPARTQPITFARADAPPILLVTSSADTVVRPRNTESLAAKLRAKGASVETVNYPGVSHEGVAMALSVPFRTRAATLDDTARFLERTLVQRTAVSGMNRQ